MLLPNARELMVPLESYPHVREDSTLLEALTTMSRAHIQMHGEASLPRILLVFDADDVLIGMLRRRDILRGLSPRWFFSAETDHPEHVFEPDPDQNISEVMADKVVENFRERSSLPITEYVQGISGVVDADDTLIRLVTIMVKNGYHMLPVLEDGQVIGVVRSVEVMWAVNELQDASSAAPDG